MDHPSSRCSWRFGLVSSSCHISLREPLDSWLCTYFWCLWVRKSVVNKDNFVPWTNGTECQSDTLGLKGLLITNTSDPRYLNLTRGSNESAVQLTWMLESVLHKYVNPKLEKKDPQWWQSLSCHHTHSTENRWQQAEQRDPWQLGADIQADDKQTHQRAWNVHYTQLKSLINSGKALEEDRAALMEPGKENGAGLLFWQSGGDTEEFCLQGGCFNLTMTSKEKTMVSYLIFCVGGRWSKERSVVRSQTI